jgi:hypothetical protein
MMGDKIRRKVKELKVIRKAKGYIDEFREHEKRTYPYIKEDDEGVMTYLSPRKVEMVFKGISPNEGYKKTVNRFKLLGRLHKVRIELEDDKVVVDF